jgi:hypothetical protein
MSDQSAEKLTDEDFTYIRAWIMRTAGTFEGVRWRRKSARWGSRRKLRKAKTAIRTLEGMAAVDGGRGPSPFDKSSGSSGSPTGAAHT